MIPIEENKSKSKGMVFKGYFGRSASGEKWCLNRQPIEVVRKFKYFGVRFSVMNMILEYTIMVRCLLTDLEVQIGLYYMNMLLKLTNTGIVLIVISKF